MNPTLKYALTYGLLSGLVTCSILIAGIVFGDRLSFLHSVWAGYLVMLIVLTFIFVGVKRYRDVERGGIIKFLPAFGMGLAIALVAALAYVILWEIYEAATNYRFMDQYIAGIIRARRAAGVTGPALAREMAELETLRVNYANPLYRIRETFMEIFPVGLGVALVSAVILRRPWFSFRQVAKPFRRAA